MLVKRTGDAEMRADDAVRRIFRRVLEQLLLNCTLTDALDEASCPYDEQCLPIVVVS